jgi:hypothetical protein
MNHIEIVNNKIKTVKSNIEQGFKLIEQLDFTYEVWKPIDGYDNYIASSFGRVKNMKTNKILKNTLDKNGYYKVELCNNGKLKTQRNHRLVCDAFYTNPENKQCVDHIDNNPLNNHISNLRFATYQENNRNASIQKNNTSGTTGVFWNKKENKWRAKIQINRKSIHIGYYENKQDAINARIQKANEVFGEFTHKSQSIKS